ncbi:hypothetical protein ACFL4T_12375 [candidate division KSB1 bacterium]
MIKKIKLVLIIFLFGLNSAVSQEKVNTPGNDFGVTIGIPCFQVKEKVLNNIRHGGSLFSFALSYEKPRETSFKAFEFYYSVSMLKSRYDPENASYAFSTKIDYRYLKKAGEFNDKYSVFAGVITGLNSQLMFYDNWDDSHLYWLTSYYLGVDGMLNYKKSEKSTIFLEINTPIAALVSRPEARILYKTVNPEFSWIIKKLHENLRLTSIHQHFVFNMSLGYTYRPSAKFGYRLFWRFSYLKNSMSYSKDLSIVNHVFGVTLLF